MTLMPGEARRFNLVRALKSWQTRYPSKLKRIAVLEKIQADAKAKGHTWTAANVKKMLNSLKKTV